MSDSTIPSLLAPSLSANAGRSLLRFREFGDWRRVNGAELARLVRELSAGLLAFGAEPGVRVARVGVTGAEGLICDWAVAGIGAISVPIDGSADAARIRRILARTETRFVVTDLARIDRVLEIRPELPALDLVLLAHPPEGDEVAPATLLEAVREVGAERLAAGGTELDDTVGAVTGDLVACILASELHGAGVDLAPTHANLLRAAEALGASLPVSSEEVVIVSAGCGEAARRATALLCIRQGAELVLGSEETPLASLLAEGGGALAIAGRDEVERLALDSMAAIAARGAVGRRAIAWALSRGTERVHPTSPLPRADRPSLGLRVADLLLLDPLRRGLLGPRLRRLVALGPPLSEEVRRHLEALGLPAIEGVATDAACGVVAMNRPDASKRGTLGRPVPGLETLRGDKGEFRIRGPMVAAPWNGGGTGRRPEGSPPADRTLQADADGWVVSVP